VPVTSTRAIVITLSDDYIGNLSLEAAANEDSPGAISIYSLVSGANTITVPTGGSSPKGATIVPPAENTVTLTLKGVSGDTGILLSPTDPTSIAFGASPPVSFVITTNGVLDGLRIIWT